MSKERYLLLTATTTDSGRKWIIRLADDHYEVGYYSRRDNTYNAICSCEYYDQAELICETLRGNILGVTVLDGVEGGAIQ